MLPAASKNENGTQVIHLKLN